MKIASKVRDRYIKLDAPHIVWTVSHILNLGDQVRHVNLIQEGATNRKITLSDLALRDSSIYKKIGAKP